MSNGNCSSPAMSDSPVPAPPPQPRNCLRSCRFANNDSHLQQTPNYGNLSNSYTG